jgi:creatinine amidohydrolase/Fe(II)-dependent formamide hydrolase-like protein
MSDASSDRLLGELTFQDVSRLLSPRSVLVLPVGSIEQHGPHLPLNTDVLIAEALSAAIVERWAGTFDLWQLPAISVSLAREHEWAAGSLSLSVAGMTQLIHDLGRTIRRSLPTRNLFIVNAHGGNRGILEALCRDLRADLELNVCVFHPAALSDGAGEGPVPEIHAGKNETSIMLAIAPHLVRLDRLSKEATRTEAQSVQETILDPAVTWPWSSSDAALADAGVIGSPHAATREFGEQLIEAVVARAGGVLQRLVTHAVTSEPVSSVLPC